MKYFFQNRLLLLLLLFFMVAVHGQALAKSKTSVSHVIGLCNKEKVKSNQTIIRLKTQLLGLQNALNNNNKQTIKAKIKNVMDDIIYVQKLSNLPADLAIPNNLVALKNNLNDLVAEIDSPETPIKKPEPPIPAKVETPVPPTEQTVSKGVEVIPTITQSIPPTPTKKDKTKDKDKDKNTGKKDKQDIPVVVEPQNRDIPEDTTDKTAAPKPTENKDPKKPEDPKKDVIVTNEIPFWLWAIIAGLAAGMVALFFAWRNKGGNSIHTNDEGLLKEKADLLQQKRDLETKNRILTSDLVVAEEARRKGVNYTPPPGRYFYGEAFVTAGPRKGFVSEAKEGEVELGEDVAGFIIKDKEAIFWVLDGTSDSDALRDSRGKDCFSSRLLAQTIGWNIQNVIATAGNSYLSAEKLLQTALKGMENDINNSLDKMPASDKQRLEQILHEKTEISCSTTALVGILDITGNLQVCQIGDSKVLAFGKDKQPQSWNESKGRQFANIRLKQGQVKVTFNEFSDTRAKTNNAQNIHAVLAMTDGISEQTEAWLKTIQNIDFGSQTVRQPLMSMRQNTQDDKALCVIQIKG